MQGGGFPMPGRKTLNDIMVLRMLYLDYFFLFMGMNAEQNPDQTLVDPNQYLFLMKEMQVKSEFKIHESVLFLDKNVDNFMGNKFLLSLGYDQNYDPTTGQPADKHLVFKIWDFISLDRKSCFFCDCVIGVMCILTFIHLQITYKHRWPVAQFGRRQATIPRA